MLGFCIDEDDPARPDVLRLIEYHHRQARANSPPGLCFPLDVEALRAPGVWFWTARDGPELLGMAALKQLDASHGEIKSMRTVETAQGKGVGSALLDHALAQARRRGLSRVSLETGGNQAFAAARRLYERAGFTRCPPFADYQESDFNLFYSLGL